MKPKICFIMTDAVSFNVLYRNQLEYIRDSSNFEITLICGGSREQLDILRARNLGEVVDLNFQRKPSVLQDAKSLVLLTRYLFFRRFDIVVYLTPKALLLGSIASTLTMQKRRVAFSVGRAYENFSGLKKRAFQGLDQLSFGLSHEVLFVSDSLVNVCLSENLLEENKARVIDNGSFNGIDIDVLRPVEQMEKQKSRRQYRVPVDAFVICVVGRICEDKGLKDIGEISESLKSENIHFMFIGDFEDDIGKSVVDRIMREGKGVYIPANPKVEEVIQCADLHLFLSYREGFGNVAIEAASCGVPTFAYDVVGVKDSVKQNISGQKFQLKDTVSVTKAIKQAITDTSFKDKYPKARAWAVQHFEQKELWQSYLDFYLHHTNKA